MFNAFAREVGWRCYLQAVISWLSKRLKCRDGKSMAIYNNLALGRLVLIVILVPGL